MFVRNERPICGQDHLRLWLLSFAPPTATRQGLSQGKDDGSPKKGFVSPMKSFSKSLCRLSHNTMSIIKFGEQSAFTFTLLPSRNPHAWSTGIRREGRKGPFADVTHSLPPRANCVTKGGGI